MIELTEQQRQALETGSEPPVLVDGKTQTAYVLLRKDLYDHLRELLDNEQDRKLEAGWQKLAGRGIALTLDDET
jgi:hypothetical protein